LTAWTVERHAGPAAALHGRDLPDPFTPAVWVLEATAPALVLGSTQPDDGVDREAAVAAEIEVVRRHSGGGAVLLVPDEHLWVDVLLPAGDPRWHDDVGRAAHWVGDVWANALADLGIDAAVHRGPMQPSAWSRAICFAGLGPGEVTAGGRKIVGVSQRRTRAGARFQCVALARWDPAALGALVGVDPADVADAAAGVDVPLAALEAAFFRHT
jgi:lipoate-protein ligase A